MTKKKALLVVYCRNDYVPNAKREYDKLIASATNACRLMEDARARHDTIVHIEHVFKKEGQPFCIEGTIGTEINEIACPQKGEPIVIRYDSNIFLNNNLKEILDENGVKEIVICGSMTKSCVMAAAHATVELGYPITVIYDACCAVEYSAHDSECKVDVVERAVFASLTFVHGYVESTDEYLATNV
ncbi:isochorismatase family protein [Pseudovibrio sp. Tun.PSC04-5.I4]|uniref:isochorismatase family protein n=1 Tax=Pseudovibrio sp. Tun.PSC04-5.I4 TaxID=1798213 RepID=UPI00088EE2ED|nr:isochorismatase family protein [Pseudovibrio sp. Tun.PSC04-5.I4]SDR30254.1 Nicotinamidase-related amidase [Pseudovibrio sp. Tun.PSC04-5.I4]